MNYGHKCGVAGCGHAFLTRKRLELHCRVMHGLELNGECVDITLGFTAECGVQRADFKHRCVYTESAVIICLQEEMPRHIYLL